MPDFGLANQAYTPVKIIGTDGSTVLTLNSTAGGDGTGNAIVTLAVRSFNHVYNGSTWDRLRKANASARIPSSAASNNATVVKASAGDVLHIHGLNATAGVKYLKLYNKATTPAPGTDNALLLGVYALAASAPFSIDFGALGLYFPAGIGLALVTGASDTDNTGVAAGDILGLNVNYH
jgi:hypothetical protein